MRLLLIAILLITTSCATVLKKSTYNLKVISPGIDDKVEVDGKVYPVPADIPVKRSKEDLHIRLLSDTTSTDFTVEAYPNGTFLYGNLLWVTACPAAYAIDLTNPKRFHYGKQVVLNRNAPQRTFESPIRKDVNAYFAETFPNRKGDFVFTPSLSFMNFFYLEPEGKLPFSSTGFIGVTAGIEYFHKDNQYFSLNTGIVTDAIWLGGEQFEGIDEDVSSTYLTLTNNHQIKRFHFGYGLNLSRNRWIWENLSEPDPSVPPADPESVYYIKKASTGVGITLNAYHQFTDYFMFGVVYRPTFFCFDQTPKWTYEHVVTLDVKFRVPLFQSKKKPSEQK